MGLPNILTVGRLVAAPLIALVFALLPRPVADWIALALFIGASATDWLDGRLARAWQQVSPLGTMLDPIADKAMVAVALLVLVGLGGGAPAIMVPATAILFREVFVSGLREFLGGRAVALPVSFAAKWKTAVQMAAISLLFAHGILAHHLGAIVFGMDAQMAVDVLEGRVEDVLGLRALDSAETAVWWGGLALLWLAAGMTLTTGWAYFQAARGHLREGSG